MASDIYTISVRHIEHQARQPPTALFQTENPRRSNCPEDDEASAECIREYTKTFNLIACFLKDDLGSYYISQVSLEEVTGLTSPQPTPLHFNGVYPPVHTSAYPTGPHKSH